MPHLLLLMLKIHRLFRYIACLAKSTIYAGAYYYAAFIAACENRAHRKASLFARRMKWLTAPERQRSHAPIRTSITFSTPPCRLRLRYGHIATIFGNSRRNAYQMPNVVPMLLCAIELDANAIPDNGRHDAAHASVNLKYHFPAPSRHRYNDDARVLTYHARRSTMLSE